MIRKRLTKNEHGEPLLTITVEGTHDVYRLARHLERGQVEFARLGSRTLRSLQRQLGYNWFRQLRYYFEGKP